MGDGDVLEHRVPAVRDRVDAHDLALALAQAVAGELAEGPLGRARPRQDLALEHHLGVSRYEHVGGLALHQLERLAQEPAHDPALVLVDRPDGERPEGDRRVDADHQRERQRLVPRLGDPLKLPQVLAGGQVDRGRVAPLDLQPVVGAVPDLAVGSRANEIAAVT